MQEICIQEWLKTLPNNLKHNLKRVQLCEMDNLSFLQENSVQYKLNSSLLSHSKISDSNRARLFTWLSQQCSRQRISRYSYTLTCTYIDLFFMKKNDIQLKNYQILALGALILATKLIQAQGKLPSIDLNLFKLDELLEMENKIILSLNYYLNPPIYIELINNIAKIWDNKCATGEIQSNVRYFEQNITCYLRLKTLYEKLDTLNLFKKTLNFHIQDVVFTLFYHQTQIFHQQIQAHSGDLALNKMKEAEFNPENIKTYEQIFKEFVEAAQIQTQPKQFILKILQLLTLKNFPIDESSPIEGKTFAQLTSFQTHNKFGYEFFKKFNTQINKL